MEKILRQCYKESKIIGVNSIVFKNRISSIERILENEILNDEELSSMTKWMLGIESKNIEDILIKLEESFCEEDPNFSKDKNIKELKILVGILIYQYSKNEENKLLPMMVICECQLQSSLISECLYQLFAQYMNGIRLSMRHQAYVEKGNYTFEISQFKKSVEKKKKVSEEEGASFAYDVTEMDSIVIFLEKCENNFKYIMQREEYLYNELCAQKEETNIAWWLLNEWSESYQCPFSKLKIEEAALAIPVELYKLSQYALGPYAIRAVIYKGVSNCKKEINSISLENFVNVVKDKVIDLIDIEKMELEQMQPILLALKCMYECKESTDDQAWKAVFEGRSKRKVVDLIMSADEFAYQLYLELELTYLKE